MSSYQQAIILTSAAFLLGVAMIFGGLAMQPDKPFLIVTESQASSTDDMGVSGVGSEPDASHPASHDF